MSISNHTAKAYRHPRYGTTADYPPEFRLIIQHGPVSRCPYCWGIIESTDHQCKIPTATTKAQ